MSGASSRAIHAFRCRCAIGRARPGALRFGRRDHARCELRQRRMHAQTRVVGQLTGLRPLRVPLQERPGLTLQPPGLSARQDIGVTLCPLCFYPLLLRAAPHAIFSNDANVPILRRVLVGNDAIDLVQLQRRRIFRVVYANGEKWCFVLWSFHGFSPDSVCAQSLSLRCHEPRTNAVLPT
jgi:hypothetical protein